MGIAIGDIFFGRVGHDLRGELATMLAGVHYLLRYERGLGDPAREMLERVHGAGDRMRRLLDELDQASWLTDEPRPEVAAEPFTLEALVEAVHARVAKLATTRGVRLEREIDEGEREFLASPDLVTVAVGFAVDLAVLRSRDRPVQIVARFVDGAPRVSVIDEAGPVAPETVNRIFEAFAERDALPKDPAGPRRRERLGLGLAIGRAILESQGGFMEARSTEKGLQIDCSLTRAVEARVRRLA